MRYVLTLAGYKIIVDRKATIPPEGESQMRKRSTRALTFLLSVAMTITMSGTPVYAVADDQQPKTGLCEHHPDNATSFPTKDIFSNCLANNLSPVSSFLISLKPTICLIYANTFADRSLLRQDSSICKSL